MLKYFIQDIERFVKPLQREMEGRNERERETA